MVAISNEVAGRIAQADTLNEGERTLALSLAGYGSSFMDALIAACMSGSAVDLERVGLGFPEIAAAVQSLRAGDLPERCRALGYNITGGP